MNAVTKTLNIRLPEDMFSRLDRVRQWLGNQLPAATRTDAARMVIQKGLEAFEAEAERNSQEDRAWLGSDLSRLGEFEPYDFGGLNPETLGTPVRHLPSGAFVVEGSR